MTDPLAPPDAPETTLRHLAEQHTCHDMNPPHPSPCCACERETTVTEKQLKMLRMWAAEYHKLGNDPSAAPELSAESRKWKLIFADGLDAILADRDRLVNQLRDNTNEYIEACHDVAIRHDQETQSLLAAHAREVETLKAERVTLTPEFEGRIESAVRSLRSQQPDGFNGYDERDGASATLVEELATLLRDAYTHNRAWRKRSDEAEARAPVFSRTSDSRSRTW